MSGNFSHSSPSVYMQDSGGGHPQSKQYYQQKVLGTGNPPLVPCWTFPPARAQMKKRRWGTMNTGMTWVLIMILMLVFAALGLGAYQILRLQTEVKRLTQEMPVQSIAPQRQIGVLPAELSKLTQKSSAHVIGCADQAESSGTLKWEARHGEVFTNGIKYSNGFLQVNETGLYFVYSRVEFLSKTCKPKDSLIHMVNLKRNERDQIIMEDNKEGFCMSGGKQVWMTGSHLSSLQRLKQSDRLYVNVSHPKLLSKNFHYNYFGLFRVH